VPQASPVDMALAAEPGGGGGASRPVAANEAIPSAFFRSLFEREISYVWTSLKRLGVPERDREDLAHEVFFRVYQRLDSYDAARPIRPWLFAFAVRVASEDRRRARHRYEELGGEDDAATEAVTPEAHDGRDREMVLCAMNALDMDKRAVLVMHDLDGHSVPEIALALSIPEGTAYSRLRAAREQITQAIRRQKRREG
jgi:RNA polymerase sigma-70 factor (ECF subfamily)